MKNILFLLLLTINLFASSYTDDFSTSNSNWTTITGCSSMSFSSGTFNSSVAWSRNGAFFNASDITADSQIISSNIYYTTAVIQTYLAARIQPNVQTCYYFGFYNNSSEWRIGKLINTANYTLSSASMSSKPSGTKFSLRVWDDSIVGYIDDIPVDTVIDSDIQSGYAGYYVYATDNPGRYDNFNLVDNVRKVPATITSQPRDTSVDETTSALFNITADGTGLSYQWIRNNSNVGGNANSYSFTTAMSNNGDSVWCIVSADTGSPVTSTKAYLTVTEFNGESFDSTEITSNVGNTKECPQIIVQPESDTVAVGSDSLLSFIVQAVGSNLSYQWKKAGVNVGTNANYYQLIGVKSDSGSYIKCVITGDTCSPVTTDSVLVAVIGEDENPPVITLQPHDTTVTENTTVTFTTSATGATNYQWWVNDIPVNGATNPSYSFTATSGMNGYPIYCAIWNDYDFVHTDTVTLTVTATPPAAITTQPQNANVTAGQTATFTIAGTNINKYQWYGNNTLIPGATGSSYSFTATIELDGSTIFCIVNDTLSSDTVTLSVTLAVTFNQSVDTLKLVCSANNSISYQWYQNDTVKVGATDSVLTILADSLFYSKKQVIYCLVNGTTKSGEWRFGFYDMLLRRWGAFKAAFKSAFKSAWK